jgi:hypothetical protein
LELNKTDISDSKKLLQRASDILKNSRKLEKNQLPRNQNPPQISAAESAGQLAKLSIFKQILE